MTWHQFVKGLLAITASLFALIGLGIIVDLIANMDDQFLQGLAFIMVSLVFTLVYQFVGLVRS